MSLVKEEHARHMRSSFRRFWEEKKLTDITIVVEGKRFECHKFVLATLSVYYETLFSSSFHEAFENELTLPVDSETFEEVLHFMYCVTDSINTLHAENLFKVADFLQIDSLKAVLREQLLQELNVVNCLEWFRLADLYNCPKLLECALSCAASKFENIFNNSQFLLLRSDLICSILSRTNLKISSEEDIFQAVVNWFNYKEDEEERKASLSQILEHIRFPQMSLEYLTMRVAKEKFMKPLSRLRLIEEAKNYHANPHLRHTFSNLRTIPRHYEQEVNMFCIVGCKAVEKKDGSYSQTKPTVHMFDLTFNKWYRLNYTLDEKLLDCTNFAVCPYKHGVYISGGPRNCKGLSFLDVRSKVLYKRRQMTTQRMFHSLVAVNNKIYALGGKNLDDERLSSVEMLNCDDNKRGWQIVGFLPVAVSDMSATIHHDKIYIFGGLTGLEEDVPIQCFDIVKNKGYIIQCNTVPDRFIMPKCVLCDNRIIVVCGDGSVHEFFPDDVHFEHLGQIQSFRKKHYFGCIQYGGCVFVFGGVGTSQDVLSFDLRTKLTRYYSHLSPVTCTSVYGGFFTSTKLSGLSAL